MYYGKIFQEASVEKMKAFIGMRLAMEPSGIVKPRFEDYFRGDNFLLDTPGFKTVMQRDQFLAIWASCS